MTGPRVCVVGSSNLDLNTYTDRFPAPGETVHGRRFTTGYGGKGANQAVMAARLGGAVALVARVGRDLFGRDMVEHFRGERIDTRFVAPTEGVSTGTAVITVDAAGRNTIVVTPGANGRLTPQDVEDARPAIEAARILVCQQEVPAEANLAAMRIAARARVPVVFNPAPAGDGVPVEAYQLSAVLCPNEHEASLLTGREVSTHEQAEAASRELMSRGAGSVVVTLGERGCLVVTADGVTALAAPAVEAVDTTGAGDAFIGSLAFFLARGDDLIAAARRANRIAAVSVRLPGTQTSFPRAADLPADLFQ
ncbi:MAG TPA: ribokinase [Gemmataceae bacterium]|nr:ribokinase [Gemmataceae bacterium]